MSKVVVISSDAMVGEDLNYYKTLPSYQKYFQGGAEITNVSSIYPTVTFPAHATMMTGMYPDRHGIFSNMQLIPEADPTPWQWDSSFLTCSDIFHAAKAAGKTTAAVFWPVTAGNPAIDYHIADYWAQGMEDTTEKAFARAGASTEVLEIVKKHKHLFEGVEREHPQRDAFGMACAADIIRRFRPDLLLVHPANLDAARHDAGVFGPHIDRALEDLDRWIGWIGSALEEAGILEETNLFLVSDHGQQNVCRNISLNVLFAENGLIRLDENGKVKDWDAWCLSNGMSALVFLKDPSDQALYAKVRGLLESLQKEEVYGFSRLYTQEEARKEERFGGPFSFVLETDGYTAFGDFVTRPLVSRLDNEDYRFGQATHGYLPRFGPQPILLAKGPSIRENVILSGNHIVNEAPTYAKILGADLGDTDGKPIEEILKA